MPPDRPARPALPDPASLPVWRRWLLLVVGVVALGLGILGVVLPGLPTTPFVLLAAGCFVRASPPLHRWLLAHPWLGPPLRDWERDRRITRRTRWVALVSMSTMVAISVWAFQGRLWLQGGLVLAAAIGAWVVCRIPLRPASPKR